MTKGEIAMSLGQRIKAAWAVLSGDVIALIKHVEALGLQVRPMGDGGPGEVPPK